MILTLSDCFFSLSFACFDVLAELVQRPEESRVQFLVRDGAEAALLQPLPDAYVVENHARTPYHGVRHRLQRYRTQHSSWPLFFPFLLFFQLVHFLRQLQVLLHQVLQAAFTSFSLLFQIFVRQLQHSHLLYHQLLFVQIAPFLFALFFLQLPQLLNFNFALTDFFFLFLHLLLQFLILRLAFLQSKLFLLQSKFQSFHFLQFLIALFVLFFTYLKSFLQNSIQLLNFLQFLLHVIVLSFQKTNLIFSFLQFRS